MTFHGFRRLRCVQNPALNASLPHVYLPTRCFTAVSSKQQDAQPSATDASTPPPPPPHNPTQQTLTPKEHALLTPADPETASTRREERVLMRQGRPPIGSRRRRAAVASTTAIPFEQLPYQCFQEARKVLLEDRQQKLKEIEGTRARIERIKMQEVGHDRAALQLKERRLITLMQRLEKLKVLADINDPLVKKRFEDGEGDMEKPVYRHLAREKFMSRRYLILKQRLSQMHVYPDLLPPFDPSCDIGIHFGRKEIEPGAFVPSIMSEQPPRLQIQPFDKGERYVTIIAMDPDVPNVEADAFDKFCHFMAVNIPIGPSNTKVNLVKMMGAIEMQSKSEGEGEVGYESKEHETVIAPTKRKLGDVVHPWIPPYAVKGSPYHRIGIIVLQQVRQLDVDQLKKIPKYGGTREELNIVTLMSRFQARPIGGSLFRTQWDSGSDALMERMGRKGTDLELKRKKVEPLPYKWKPSWSERYR